MSSIENLMRPPVAFAAPARSLTSPADMTEDEMDNAGEQFSEHGVDVLELPFVINEK